MMKISFFKPLRGFQNDPRAVMLNVRPAAFWQGSEASD